MEDTTTEERPVSEAQVPPSSAVNKSNRSKLFIPIIAGIVLLSGVGAAAFNASVQNTPEKIWADALDNTAKGFDSFVDDTQDYDASGVKLNGSFNLKSPIAADGTVKGAWQDKNAQIESTIGVSGLRIDSEVRAITNDESNTPDVYVYVDGLDVVQGFLGESQSQIGSIIEQVNGQWILIDRTLIDQGFEQIEQGTSVSTDAVMLSEDELNDITGVTSEVTADYLFSDGENAVFQINEQLGEEEFDGTSTYKYSVTVDKENLKSFTIAYKDALKETQFDEYVVSASEEDDTFEEVIKFDQIIKSIDETDFSKTKNEVWVDLDKRFIRNIRITPTEQDSGTIGFIEFALPYDGGDVLPLTFRINTGKEEATGNEIKAEFVAGYNQVDSSFDFSFDIEGTVDQRSIDVKANLNITPSDDPLEVEKPNGATNVLEIISQLQESALSSELQLENGFDQFQLDDVEL